MHVFGEHGRNNWSRSTGALARGIMMTVKMAHKKALKKILHWLYFNKCEKEEIRLTYEGIYCRNCSFYSVWLIAFVVPLDETQQSKYQKNIDALRSELEKDKPSISVVKRIMVATFDGRRAWIKSDTPSVEEVLDVFPSLKESNRKCHVLILLSSLHKYYNISYILVTIVTLLLYSAAQRTHPHNCEG